MAATLMKRPDIALAAAVHALALPVFFHAGGDTCLRIQLSRPDLKRSLFAIERCKAVKAIAAEEKRWRKKLPQSADEMFAWCLAQTQETLLELLAFVTALSVDTIQDKYRTESHAAPSDALAEGARSMLRSGTVLLPRRTSQGCPAPRSCSRLKRRLEASPPPRGASSSAMSLPRKPQS